MHKKMKIVCTYSKHFSTTYRVYRLKNNTYFSLKSMHYSLHSEPIIYQTCILKILNNFVHFFFHLRYFSTGTYFAELKFDFRVGRSTIGIIVKDTCQDCGQFYS